MKLVVVVGGSSGIGFSIMKKLSGDYRVVNMSRTKAVGMNNIHADVTDHQSVKTAFDTLLSEYGSPDIMIYCAGYVNPLGILETTEQSWNQTIQTNLTGAFYCTQEFSKMNKGKDGKIIYIASTAGTRAQPGWSAYSASKAGLINFSLTMAEELKDEDIKVYCVAPGRCATPLRKILAPDEDPSTITQPEEVAEFIEYLVCCNEVIDNQVIVF